MADSRIAVPPIPPPRRYAPTRWSRVLVTPLTVTIATSIEPAKRSPKVPNSNGAAQARAPRTAKPATV